MPLLWYRGLDLHLHLPVTIQEFLPRDLAGRATDRATEAVHPQNEGEQVRYGLDQFLREARTLAELDRGFLQRNIKPQNVYLVRLDSGAVRHILLAYGSACQALGEHSRSLSVVLTPAIPPSSNSSGDENPP